jgi:hypothetical protein
MVPLLVTLTLPAALAETLPLTAMLERVKVPAEEPAKTLPVPLMLLLRLMLSEREMVKVAPFLKLTLPEPKLPAVPFAPMTSVPPVTDVLPLRTWSALKVKDPAPDLVRLPLLVITPL